MVDSGVMDVRVRATLAAPTVNLSGGIAAWVTDADNGVYLVANPTSYTFGRRSAGANTLIATHAVAPVAGDVLELVTAGKIVRCYVNGVLAGEHLNLTAPPPATGVGFWGTGPTGAPRFDDITVTNT